MTQDPEFDADPEGPETALEQRVQTARPNRNIAVLLVGAVFTMLAAAFGVAMLVVYGGF
jgi:hypothetical protein